MPEPTKFLLSEADIPSRWINLLPDLPGEPLPPLSPATGQPAGPDDLTPIFPMGLIAQEVSMEPEVEIPEAVREAYGLWRPTPLFRARRLEQALGTSARIYYKYEGTSPAGSHKPNTAVPQAYENAEAGIKKLSTETGAGQWGSSLAFACSLFGLECEVFMVGSSYDQKPYRRTMMQTWGATVDRSPSELTQSGRSQAEHPTGSLGIAISEAVEVAAQDPDCNYALGSVLNHVLLHQTVIGQEAILQMELAGEEPDVIVGCVGGGSNFAGLVFPFLRSETTARIVAAEPAACPTLTRGVYRYDFGDTAGLTPLMPMYTLGHDFVPAPVHAGGLRYHGDAPMLCGLVNAGRIEARAYPQSEPFEPALRVARRQGLIPAAPPPPGAGAGPRDPRRDRRGRARRGERDPVRALRPRPLRPRGLRRLPRRHARGPGVLRGRHGGRPRAAAGGAGDRLTRVVEDDPERGPAPARHRADTVPQSDPVVAALAGVGSLAGREEHEGAARRGEDMRPALRPRALPHQHELAPFEVVAEHRQRLEREVDVAVDVLLQRVPVPGAVAQDQRRRALLAGLVAAGEQLLVRERECVIRPAEQR